MILIFLHAYYWVSYVDILLFISKIVLTYLLWEKLVLVIFFFFQIEERRSDLGWLILLGNNLFLSKNTLLPLKHKDDMNYFYECDTTILLSKVNIKKFELRLENVAKTSCWKNRQYRFFIKNICEICDLQISGQIKYYVLCRYCEL